ncbi:putative transcriptional regulator [Actinopolymorpha rutila]|uniref:Putative transcriptional regulator n=1 Tax=Actinopolymorpha rutila TaxID=446787 RepID=A0A852Z8P0_9ACTN|nr:putative transcriptional regulator [Actinopolymorpha rutila]
MTRRGSLKLVDGREFATPSKAAATIAKLSAAPGWSVWRVGRDGPTLHELRQELLLSVTEEAAAANGGSTDGGSAARQRFESLNDARKKAEAGTPEKLTVRDLLKFWHLEDRDRAGSAQIAADLANHSLTTVPDFRAVNLDRVVSLVTISEAESAESSDGSVGSVAAPDELNEEDSFDIGLTLGNLLSDQRPLASVEPSASFDQAITIMLLNDYSQVAVLTSPDVLHGAVSWKSIAQAKNADPKASFSSAIIRDAKVFSYSDRLLDVLDVLQKEEFIFVRDFDGRIYGIITAADVVNKYDETATPFFLIGEVDQELRQLIQSAFDKDLVKMAYSNFSSFDKMTMGQYQAVLNDANCWRALGWSLDRTLFIERLNEIRNLRNTVMHFNPDPIRDVDVEKLRHFLNLIRAYNR